MNTYYVDMGAPHTVAKVVANTRNEARQKYATYHKIVLSGYITTHKEKYYPQHLILTTII